MYQIRNRTVFFRGEDYIFVSSDDKENWEHTAIYCKFLIWISFTLMSYLLHLFFLDFGRWRKYIHNSVEETRISLWNMQPNDRAIMYTICMLVFQKRICTQLLVLCIFVSMHVFQLFCLTSEFWVCSTVEIFNDRYLLHI